MQYVAKFSVPLACAPKMNGVAELSSLQSAGKRSRRHVRDVYVDNLITTEQAMDKLIDEELHHQACISNQEIIDKYLIFSESFEVWNKSRDCREILRIINTQ